MGLPAHTGGEPALASAPPVPTEPAQDVADRFIVWWHALHYVLLLIATVLALTDDTSVAGPAVAGSVFLGVWYWLLVIRQPQRWERPLAMAPYFTGLFIGFVVLTGYHSAYTVLIWALYPQVFAFLGRWWGSAGALLVSVLWAWRLGMLDDIGSQPQGAVDLLLSTSVAVLVGLFIWSVVTQSQRRRETILELDAVRRQLAEAAAHREALLAETRLALEERNTLVEASAALSAARTPADVVAAIGTALSPAVQRVAIVHGGAPTCQVVADWRRESGLSPLPEHIHTPPLRGRSVVRWPAADLAADVSTDWQAGDLSALVCLALRAPTDGEALVVAVAEPAAADDRWLRLLEALATAARLALDNLRLVDEARQSGVTTERARLARDIHDTLAQGFTSVVMQLEAAEADLDVGGDVRPRLDRARTTARESLVEARRVVADLRPDLLDDASLPEALRRATSRLAAAWQLDATMTTTGSLRRLPSTTEVALLRVAQEAIANAGKHAHASRVDVALGYDEHHITLEIRDDGIGIAAGKDAGGMSGGYGLRAMRERIAAVGGNLQLDAPAAGGTTVTVTLPLVRAQPSPAENTPNVTAPPDLEKAP